MKRTIILAFAAISLASCSKEKFRPADDMMNPVKVYSSRPSVEDDRVRIYINGEYAGNLVYSAQQPGCDQTHFVGVKVLRGDTAVIEYVNPVHPLESKTLKVKTPTQQAGCVFFNVR